MSTSSRQQKRLKKRILIGSAVVGAVTLLGTTAGVLIAATGSQTPPPVSDKVAAYYSNPPTPTLNGEEPPLTVTRPDGRPLRVLVAGDSISQGRFATLAEDAYVPTLRAGLEAGGPVQLDVIGNSGYTSEQVTPDIPKQAYDLVLVELGTNDAMKENPGKFGEDYRAFITAVRAASPDAPMICAGAWQTNYRASSVDPLIASTCVDFKGRYVSLNPLFNVDTNRGPDKARGVYGVGDNFHPNSAGHKAIAARLLEELAL